MPNSLIADSGCESGDTPCRAEARIAFLGGSRYSRPLDETSRKKFQALSVLGEVFVIGFSKDRYPRKFIEHAHFYLLPQLPSHVVRYFETFLIAPLLACWLIFGRGVRTLVAQSPYEGFAAALAKKIAGWVGCRVSLIVEAHGDFEKSLFMQRRIWFPGLYRSLMCHAAGFALKHADRLRAVSSFTKEQLARRAPGKTIFQLLPWTDISVFVQAGIHRAKHSSQIILYAGVLIPLKGIHHLINAFAPIAKDFPQARLFIVGREENKNYAADLKEHVKRLGMYERVQFMGPMPQTELASWMQKACVFVLPSASEGLGRVAIEAMATGTPVIASHVGGIPEVVEEGNTGFLVSPGDERALAEKLRWVLENSDEAHEMGERGREFAKRLFCTEAYIEGYRRIFEISQSSTEQVKHAPSTV
jgi:glycosyltransferase involved in cell wall biosynthesis